MRVAATKARAWAIGAEMANGFHPRRIVWGRLLARLERREGETLARVVIVPAEPQPKRRSSQTDTEARTQADRIGADRSGAPGKAGGQP